MFLHAGAGTVVRGEDIIGIFDLDGKITTSDTADFLRRAEKDGVAEVLEHESLPVWSVQFHPERMCFAHRREDTADGSLVLRWFLERL